MATYRIGIGSDFQLKDNAVGVGSTTTGLGNLIIDGTLKASGLSASGVTTFISYSGFTADEISGNLTLTGEHQTTGDIVVGTGKTFTVSVGATVDVGSVESVSIGTHFSPPTGDINDRPEVPVEGTVRFNKDLNTLEFYNGVEWRQFTVSGASSSGRAIIAGGVNPGHVLEYFNISTLGNSEFFGMLTEQHFIFGCFGSSTRGIAAGGFGATPTPANSLRTIEYWNIAPLSNAVDFGDTSATHFRNSTGCSNSTRGLHLGGGHPSYYNTIEYIQINTLGNALDFGDATAQGIRGGAFASPTRGFFAGGFPTYQTNYDMITIAAKGNAIDFGEMTQQSNARSGFSNNVRGFFAGGYYPGATYTYNIDMIISASGGNAVLFGELPDPNQWMASTSSQIRGVMTGGIPQSIGPTSTNAMHYINIESAGNAMDFGDLTDNNYRAGGTSDSHGGLGGY